MDRHLCCRRSSVPVTLGVDKEGAILPRLIWWDNGVIFQIDQILYKCRASSNKVGGGGITDSLGKRKTKWISTGLTVKGNKKRAEAILMDARRNFNPEEPKVMNGDILFGAFYGLRRSEAIGLKWDAIDFDQNTITIRHTVTSCDLDGKRVLVASDTTKTKSSMRTLPLVPFMRERLLTLKEEQQENRRLCGRSYIKEYLEYVCVNEIGDLIKPHYVTESFPKLLKAKGMRQIRYHDLRHSCASLLLANVVPMKQIQEWLGHSDFSTTANIYAHLDYSSKLTSADAMLNGLGFAQN